MSKDYKLKLPAHTNIYTNNDREFTIYFSEPQTGINNSTGLLLLIPGFGGDATSNVYRKMRSEFADKYNLVTIQCDYFGQEFMQNSDRVNINNDVNSKEFISKNYDLDELLKLQKEDLVKIISGNTFILQGEAVLNENQNNFNDMGLMQALDNLTSIYYVIAILNDNGYNINLNKVISYGHSHGAYLAHLCNVLDPILFTHMVDNSGWLFPKYLKEDRILFSKIGNSSLRTKFNYFAKEKFKQDEDILDLKKLYSNQDNYCEIYSYHGTEDTLILAIEKEEFCKTINNCHYIEINDSKLDFEIFFSSKHGLDSDHLKLFDFSYKRMTFLESNKLFNNRSYDIHTDLNTYHIDFSTGAPKLIIT